METYRGHVRTPADAIKLFEACRLGLLPRVQRRLSEKERQSINSGSVFVWDEREAGMRRWTDGKSWSASRVSGSFLTYREMEGKRGGGQFVQAPARRMQRKTPESGRGSDEDQMEDVDGPDGYRYKPDGLMKQSFSITTSNGQHLHLISYYSRPNPNAPDLPQPTTDAQLRHIVPVKGMYPESTVHEASGPAVTRTPMTNQSPQMHQYQNMQQNQHMQQPQRGPPYPQQAHPPPGYAWPPSPVATPPFQGQHYPSPMYGSGLPPPPPHQAQYQQQGPGSAHGSPYMQQGPGSAQTSPYQLPQSQHLRNPPPAAHMYPQPTTFDRPPPPLSDSSLPPPPHHRPIGMSSATAAQMPMYAPNPSHRIAQAQGIAEQQAAQHRQQQPFMVDPRLAQMTAATLPPVQLNGTASQPHWANGSRTTPPPQNTSASRGTTPQSNGRPSPQGTPKLNGSVPTSQVQSIPSIIHLVHPTDSVSVINDNKSNSSRGSKSPKEEPKSNSVSHAPLATHTDSQFEDRRAISVLDRKFHI